MQTIDKKSTTLETLADLFRDAFEEWLSGLDMERPALSEQSKKTLAESMRASMAWRDSILVSATCSNSSEYDAVKLKGFAFHREHEEWLGRMISGSLKDETLDEDRTVCRRAVGMLFDIVEAVEDIDIELQAQPLAVISYLLWWMGDARAMLAAMRAVAIDEECSLAAIVIGAVHGGRWPAPPSEAFLCGRLPTARIITVGTPAPRNTEPQGVRRARGRSGG